MANIQSVSDYATDTLYEGAYDKKLRHVAIKEKRTFMIRNVLKMMSKKKEFP